MSKLTRWSSIVYASFIYSFLYVPIVILVVYSFNDSKLNAVWKGFTFEWYAKLWTNSSILQATKISLTVGLISTVIATMLGTLVAVGMYRYRFRGKGIIDAMLYVPLVMSEIVMGIALLAFFSMVEIPLGMGTLLIAHITFSIPFVVVVVNARLKGFDQSIEEASRDLGASEWQTFRLITLPILGPAIAASAMLAFTVSIDDVIVSFFVAGPASTTLPLQIFSMVRHGVTPEINALSTLMLAVTLTFVIIAQRLQMRKR
ncbi:ABC transporter permease subunit [Bacillus sp. FJAT-29790]|uniref:ABC transporter permease subunit n=1 Tax=Bacillus sp. FJAT-29790 TaxID=1895002 RepID=UPI001C2384EC|nr:ABC transporter permease subunit [Bacillus sp. FJAT-29790]MBU8879280.1 ABC transporter permease subunit [Bacillus sp. FJAT-29790]